MAGGKKGSRKAAASAAAHAASKHKTSSVAISADNEARVRDAIAGLNLTGGRAMQKGIPASVDDIAEAYDALLAHGFQHKQIQDAMQAQAGGDMSEEALLDWLCLHVDAADLPKRFVGESVSRKAAAGVKVMAKADEQRAAQRREASEEGEPAWRAAQLAAQAKPAPAAPAPRKEREKTEREKQSTRDWILQYAQEDSGSDNGSKQGEDAIEDWEIWGDPREIERRKAERARAATPPEQRKQQVAEEWALAKGEAARAKAAGDKARQKLAGQVIAGLKKETQQLGLTEEALEAMAEQYREPPAIQAAPTLAGDEWPDLHAAATNGKHGPEAGNADAAWGDAEPSLPDKLPADPPADVLPQIPEMQPPLQNTDVHASSNGIEPGAKREEQEAEGDVDLGPGMFDEDAAGMMNVAAPPQPKTLEDLVGPWGGYSMSKKKKGLVKKAVEPPPESKLPKAALQQLCQKQQWPPPKFDRLPPGGHRLAHAGIRYSVTLFMPASSGPRKKKAPPPKTFTVHEEDDGWDTIQDAQNAVALFALFSVLSSDEERVATWRQLAQSWQDTWLCWDSQRDSGKTKSQAEVDDEQRMAFVRSLVTQSAAPNGAEAKQAKQQAMPDSAGAPSVSAKIRNGSAASAASPAQVAESRDMLRRLQAWRDSAEGVQWRSKREQLPVGQIRQALLEALTQHDVAVVGGDTGCGKTTQVPQMLLDAAIEAGCGGMCSIVCTQPRRIAAISVAERVASERGDPAPGQPGSAVGYHVRLDAASTRATKLLFCTTGILLRRLASDAQLSAVSHVIVDEVHERTLQGDFLMALLKDILARRRAAGRPLKVVLMSATLDSDMFARYYGGCPVLTAGGRTFPVEQHFLEDAYELTGYRLDADSPCAMRDRGQRDRRRQLEKAVSQGNKAVVKAGWGDEGADAGALNPHFDAEAYQEYSQATRRNLARLDENRIDLDLLEELVGFIDASYEEGAILVFLPGLGEITALYERLTASRNHREGRLQVLPLHSSVSPQEQRRVFERPLEGTRKVVLATNIAETSLTIEDVVYVVDSGKLKERRYDASRGMSLLVEDWVSRASALQRKGRAGRVRPGQCFGLYTRQRCEQRMRKYQAPEMARVPLEELVLQIHLLGLGPAAGFLAGVIEPPPDKSITGAVSQLQGIGALTPDEAFTPLGRNLAQLPVDAKVGKLLVLGASLGCLSPALTIAACLSYKSPFSAPFEQQDAALRAKQGFAAAGSGFISSGQQSDHLLMVAAYNAWEDAKVQGGRQAAGAFTRKHMLSGQTLEMLTDMRMQFASMLADIGFVRAPQRGARGSAAWVDDRKAAWNQHSAKPAVVKAALCAALYPNAAVKDESAGKSARPAWNDGVADVYIHPSSINHPLEAQQFLRPYLVYLEKVKTSRTFLRDCTVVSPMALLLFGGALSVVHESGYVLVDDWLRIRASAPTAVLVKRLRGALDALLADKARRPEMDMMVSGGQIVDAIVKLLQDEEAAQAWA
ncbi:hypothetical protein CVIRNUC_010844 [Coccomyxa viridis]|uniref:RNA helicase n=1 Tax=Coccomyxa viridis TaxID=1274662 RepID=A0AAV1IK18_9CHLO|nr:hypothetical protein CVIRNUC_010844 [Coccomyxa viridis]